MAKLSTKLLKNSFGMSHNQFQFHSAVYTFNHIFNQSLKSVEGAYNFSNLPILPYVSDYVFPSFTDGIFKYHN